MTVKLEKTTLRPPSLSVLRGLFLCGIGLAASCLLLFAYLAIRTPEPYRHVWGLIPVHFFSGRAGNAGVGLELGFNRWFILLQCCTLDFIVMLLAYPLFVAWFGRVSRIPLIGPALTGTHDLALVHRRRIEQYGAFGLVLLVAFPLWSTGPLVGVLLGYILGMRTWLTFSAVVMGNVATTTGWVWFFHTLKNYDEALSRTLLALILCAAAMVLFQKLLGKTLKRRRTKPVVEQASPAE